MSRRRDALLAAAALAPILAAGRVVDPLAVGVGVAGCLGLEALLARRRAAVRAVWDRPAVQAVAVALLLVVTPLAVALVGPRALTALASGLAAYLGVLLVVTVRQRWRRSDDPGA